MKALLIVVVVIILGAGGWYYFTQYQKEALEPAPTVPPAEVFEEPGVDEFFMPDSPEAGGAATEGEGMQEPEVEETPLPALAESDEAATEVLGTLLGESITARYFTGEDLISRSVATIDALGSQQVPGAIQTVEGPGGEFEVTADDHPEQPILNEEGDPIPQFVVDPVNYQRYRVYVEMLEALDANDVSVLFRQYQPLLEEAFGQLGYPEGDFTDRLTAVIDELLATPEVSDPPRLIKPEAYYLYADEDLESLPAGQKILIRMGPDNAARVKVKLREIRATLRN